MQTKTVSDSTKFKMPFESSGDTTFVINALTKLALFSRLSLLDKNKLAKSMTLKQYAPDQIILKKGVTNHKFFLVFQGKAQVLDTREGVISSTSNKTFQNGECFGEDALIHDHSLPQESIVVVTPMLVYTITKSDFQVCVVSLLICHTKTEIVHLIAC